MKKKKKKKKNIIKDFAFLLPSHNLFLKVTTPFFNGIHLNLKKKKKKWYTWIDDSFIFFVDLFFKISAFYNTAIPFLRHSIVPKFLIIVNKS